MLANWHTLAHCLLHSAPDELERALVGESKATAAVCVMAWNLERHGEKTSPGNQTRSGDKACAVYEYSVCSSVTTACGCCGACARYTGGNTGCWNQGPCGNVDKDVLGGRPNAYKLDDKLIRATIGQKDTSTATKFDIMQDANGMNTYYSGNNREYNILFVAHPCTRGRCRERARAHTRTRAPARV